MPNVNRTLAIAGLLFLVVGEAVAKATYGPVCPVGMIERTAP